MHGDDPALYQVAESASQRNTATAAVKLLAIDGLACVVGCNNTAYRRLGAVLITFTQHFIVDAFGQCLDTLFFGFRLYRLSILLSNNRYYQFSGTAVISIFAEVDTLPSAKIQTTVSYGNSNTDTAQRGLGMSGHIIGTFQGMLILWAVLRNQSVEDGFHIHTNIWICILIDAQSATGMLAEYIACRIYS